jgi:hypothetical protein
VPDGLLARGVTEDYYILGYVIGRIRTAAVAACASNNLSDSTANGMTEFIIAKFFDAGTRATTSQRINTTPTESVQGREIARGIADATRLFHYWNGFKDIKTDPNYQKAFERAHVFSPNPDIHELVHALEQVTFGTYFGDKIGHPSLTAIKNAMRPRFS